MKGIVMQYLGSFVQATIDASPEAIWNIISDVTRHPELAGSGQVEKVEVLDPAGLGEGAIFQSNQNINGVRYITASRVRAWEPPYRFAWQVGTGLLPGVAQLWYFELTPQGMGTQVENGVVSPVPMPALLPFSLLHDAIGQADVQSVQPTLANLAGMLGVAEPSYYKESLRANPSMAALLPSPWLFAGGAGIALLGGLALLRRGRT